MKDKITFEIFSKYRNFMMGIATVSIVLYHFTQQRMQYSYGFYKLFYYIHRYIGASGVDVFLILSGIGLYYSFKKNNNLKEFYKKRIDRIIIPYVLITLPFFLIDKYLAHTKVSFLKMLGRFTFITFFKDFNFFFGMFYLFLLCMLYSHMFIKLLLARKMKQKRL